MFKFLENLDQFGVAFQPKIQYSKTKQKTVLGGIMSLLLYGMSLAYLIYVFVQWQSGVTLPKVINSQKIVQEQSFELSDLFLQLKTRKFVVSKIDPFDPQAIILQPKIYYFSNGKMIKNMSINYPNELENNFNLISLYNLSLQISEEYSQEQAEKEIMITLGQCQQDTLLQGQQCANQTLIDQFFSQPINTIIFKQFIKQFNTQTQEIETIGRESLISIQKNAAFQIQTYVRLEQSIVDTGPLFEDTSEYIYITDYRVDNAILNLNYFHPVLGYDAYVVLYYKLDNIRSIQTITYPKLSEVLAEASSIASTLLLLSYLVVILNENYLQSEAVNSVICMYFPEFKSFKITKNLFGKIIKAEKNGKSLNLQSFNQYYQKWCQISQMKLSISNQIYEISRIQFILQSLFTQESLQKVHNLGISLPNNFIIEESTSKLDISQNNDIQELKYSKIMPTVEKQVTANNQQSDQMENKRDLQNPIYKDSDFELFVMEANEGFNNI